MIDDKLRGFLTETDFDNAVIERLPGAGSDREFYRVHRGDKTAILMTGTGHGAAIDDWVEIQRYLRRLGFGAPGLFAANLEIPAALVEDLGGFAAPSLREYPTIVRELARLAVIGGERVADCPVVAGRPFDFEAFRWESTYFAERYLRVYRGIEPKIIESFNPSFDELATELASLPRFFSHRDFQSTNVSIIDGRVRIIDFQSARHGPAQQYGRVFQHPPRGQDRDALRGRGRRRRRGGCERPVDRRHAPDRGGRRLPRHPPGPRDPLRRHRRA